MELLNLLMDDKVIGWIALSINSIAGLCALTVAVTFRPFATPPIRSREAWAWLAHGVMIGWTASAAISLFWACKWWFQATGHTDIAFWLSRYGGLYDAMWRATLMWAALSHLVAARYK